MPLKDEDIRRQLLLELAGSPHREEVGVYDSVVDVLSYGDDGLHGYEIKSDADTLSRLPKQMASYGRGFERVTLVVGRRLSETALEQIPQWWGVKIAAAEPTEGVVLDDLRPSELNPTLRLPGYLGLLWRAELEALAVRLGVARGVRGGSRRVLLARLRESLTLEAARTHVLAAFRTRTWRVAR
jgi:hypothetical protein